MTNVTKYNQAEPLSAHRLFQTRDIETAREEVARKFCDHELIPGKTYNNFEVCHNHAQGLSLSLNYLRYGSDVHINPGELSQFYLVQVPLQGFATVRNGCKTVFAKKCTASILNATHETQMTWNHGCEKLLLQIDRSALHAIAENLLGRHLSQSIIFDPELKLLSYGLSRWKKSLIGSVKLAQNGFAFGKSTHKYQSLIEEELITNLLQSQRSSISHFFADEARMISTAQMNRAKAFILENITDPITLSVIANHAGCCIRSLQLAFKKQFGCSPMQYLQRQRLNHAHYLLQSLPPDSLVSSIAFDVGFSHLGRFSMAYRKVFGHSPRQTLINRRLV